MRRLLAITCLMFFLPACEEASRDIPKFNYDGWVVTDGVSVPDARAQDAGTAPDGLKYSTDGPKIEIRFPKKPPDYVIGETMTVIARITDPDGVQAQSITANVKGLDPVKMSLSSKTDEFEAKMDISSLPLKSYLWVVATDSKGNTNTSLIPFQRDPGPIITILAPKKDERAKSSLSINVVVNYEVEVLDTEKLSVRIGSTAITMTRKSHDKTNRKQIWVGTVVFKDFTPALTGKQMLLASMKNKNLTVGKASQTFYVDDKGPTISSVSHKAGDIIGGTMTVWADISDAAGLLDSSVKCVIGKAANLRIIDLKPSATKGRYEALFDARLLGVHDLYTVMSFRASDKLGNESNLGITVILDNGPPVMEMDPPPNLHMSTIETGKVSCSYPFDPVGVTSMNDLYQVPQIIPMRARIEDQGNLVPSASYNWISGIDEKNVVLYVLDDTAQPLVVDSDEDGICDSINPNIIPLGSSPKVGHAVSITMTGVPPSGAADYYNKGTYLPTKCHTWGGKTTEVEPLCKSVFATVVAPHRCMATSTTSIFTIPKVNGSAKGFTCLGLPFDFLANNFKGSPANPKDAWACAAVEAQDKLGNKGVTPPLRVFVNYSSNKTCSTSLDCPKGEVCKDLVVKGISTKKCIFLSQSAVLPSTAPMPPTCLGTMDKKTGVVNPNKPCKFRNAREGSDLKKKVFKCKVWQDYHRQQFCHNEVVCPS